MANDYSQELNHKIYTILSEEFPHLFPRFEKVPRELENAGNEPKSPPTHITLNVSILPTDTFKDIVGKVDSLYKLRNIESVYFSVARPYLWPKKVETTVFEDEDEDDCDEDPFDDDTDEDFCNLPPVGEPTEINIKIRAMDPEYYQKMKDYESDIKNWRNRVENRRARQASIKEIEKHNRGLMKRALSSYRDLWIAAGQRLKGEDNQAWLAKKAEILREELAKIESRLEGNNE